MSPMFITAIIGFALSVMALGAVAPSLTEMIYAKKVEISISREEALMQQIIRFRAITGAYPTTMADLITAGYWRTADNDNGLGGTYAFVVDGTKGLIAINTTIADATKRAQYINNYRHIFKPVDVGSNLVTTTFIMPSSGNMGAPLPLASVIQASATAPSATLNTWWYDTSGTSAVLKVSDGLAWKEASAGATGGAGGGGGGPTAANIVTSAVGLPATGTDGDIKYLYDTNAGTMTSYVWYGTQWIAYGGSGAASGSSSSSGEFFAFSAESGVANQACVFLDGLLASDALGGIYACSDPALNAGLLPSTSCQTLGRLTYDKAGDVYVCQ